MDIGCLLGLSSHEYTNNQSINTKDTRHNNWNKTLEDLKLVGRREQLFLVVEKEEEVQEQNLEAKMKFEMRMVII